LSRLLAVASAKGSPGCTFLAVGLAGYLAARGVTALLVDADAEEQGTAAYLDLPLGAATLRPAAAPLGLDAETLRLASAPVGERLSCVRVPDLDGMSGAELAAAARLTAEAVIVDLGHRAGRLQRELAAAADWLVWVVVPDRLGLERADRVLARGELRAASDGVVLNRLGRGCLKGAAALIAERHRLPVLAQLPNDSMAALAGGSAHRRRRFSRGLQELARCLHPAFPPVRRAWP
jgi:cellulose biosynthesis protein BcsQ